jgi:hypothetical protein
MQNGSLIWKSAKLPVLVSIIIGGDLHGPRQVRIMSCILVRRRRLVMVQPIEPKFIFDENYQIYAKPSRDVLE